MRIEKHHYIRAYVCILCIYMLCTLYTIREESSFKLVMAGGNIVKSP